MPDHDDKLRSQRAHLERLLDDHPQSCPKCRSADWDVVIRLHSPFTQKNRTLEVLCRKCDHNMPRHEIARLLELT